MKKNQYKSISKNTLKQVKPFIEECRSISQILYSRTDALTPEDYSLYEDRLVGMFTFINTKYKLISTIKDIEKTFYFNHLRDKSAIEHKSFQAGIAKELASEYVSELELPEAILCGYVESILQLIQTCRQKAYNTRREYNVTR